MNILTLVWSYLRARPLSTALNILLLSLGTAIITVLLLFARQMSDKMEEQARGIDLVVGAKGSPLQLILCNIFHIDFPTGNINLKEADRLARSRLIKQAIPMALGDSYRGFRIVGTTHAYPDLYHSQLASGEWCSKPMEVTLGSRVASSLHLREGDTFLSAHGLVEGGHQHEEKFFRVVGVMQLSNTPLDNLILTAVETIWEVHDVAWSSPADSSTARSFLVPTVSSNDSLLEVTSVLIQVRNAMGAVQLPRIINSQTSMQVASPAFETARLFSILGVGIDVLEIFGYVLVVMSALSIFIALYNSLKERRYDLAIMRTMGGSRVLLVRILMVEGSALSLLGCLTGIVLAHVALALASVWIVAIEKTGIDGFVFYPEEWIILIGGIVMGMMCALVPAIQAYRTDISKVLSSNS